MSNPIIHRFCERLRSNDTTLTSLNFSNLPLFEITTEDTELLLEALLQNDTVTNVEFSLPSPTSAATAEEADAISNDAKDESSSLVVPRSSKSGLLFQQILARPDCPIQSVTIRDTHCWHEICEALQHNTSSLQTVEIGSAASIFSPENTVSLDTDACQHLARALSRTTTLERLTLRRFHFGRQGLSCLIDALPSNIRKVELHQVSTDNNADLAACLQRLCALVQEICVIECRSTTSCNPEQQRITLKPPSPAEPCRLQKLRLAECGAKDFLHPILSTIKSATTLQQLELRDNQLDKDMTRTIVDWLETQSDGLEELALYENNLSDESFQELLKALSRKGTLRQLNVGRSRLQGNISFDVLPPNLRVLELSENEGLGDSHWLGRLVHGNPQVQEWRLNAVSMTDHGLENVCGGWLQHGQASQLRALDLRRNVFGSRGMESLSALLGSPHTKLIDLNLSACRLDNDAVETLGQRLGEHSSLVKLCLAFNAFEDSSCVVLAEAAKSLPALRSLDVQFGKFGRKGLKQMLSIVQENPNVDQLNYWTYASFGGQMDEIEDQISLWLRLNEAGRRVTKQPTIAPNLFPLILARAQRVGNVQALHYILHECLDVLETKR